MLEALSFDDVLIVPQFSKIKSRKDVDLTTKIGSSILSLPVISSNMDTVTGPDMASALSVGGGVGCLHRFQSIKDNVKQFKNSPLMTWCSVGLGEQELERAKALTDVGCTTLVIDVAHGASSETVTQYKKLNSLFNGKVNLIVGNFVNGHEMYDFISEAKSMPTAFKVGIGGGSACTTRIKTGCGLPTLQSILSSKFYTEHGTPFVIADGGMRSSGDIAKALAAGAHAVMLGGMLSGTDETPGGYFNYSGHYLSDDKHEAECDMRGDIYKKYRGSASQESYHVQGKSNEGRTAEGESFLVSAKGPVKNILQDIEGGLRSAFSYVNANNLTEFQERATLVKVTSNGTKENRAHGKG